MTEFSTIVNALASYLPGFQLRAIASRKKALSEPYVDRTAGAVVFVDISGFSQLTERAAEAGPAGAEALADALSAYFGRITDIITDRGGDVLTFAGDAALGVWLENDVALGDAACLAAQAGLAIQRELAYYKAAPGMTLRQRTGVGAGRLTIIEVGGLDGRWHLLVAGEAIAQAGVACQEASPDDVVLSPGAWELLQKRSHGVSTGSGAVKLGEVTEPCEPKPLDRPPAAEIPKSLLETYVPRIVRDRLEAGHAGWLAEFRSVSLVFTGFGAIDFETPGTVNLVHEAIKTAQGVFSRFEGTIYQLLADDKGATLIACFGLPPRAHEGDAVRAVRSAHAVRGQLAGLGLLPSIGIANGRAFCGAYGIPKRRQYSVVGPVINLAARLMQLADGGILCDAGTAAEARKDSGIEFLGKPAGAVKGFKGEVAAFEPRILKASTRQPARSAAIVGRTAERALLSQAVASSVGRCSGRVIVLEGEAGIGKSRLVEFAAEEAREAGLTCLFAVGEEIEKGSRFHAWRRVFQAVFDVDAESKNLEANQGRVLGRLHRFPALLPMAPLLNAILPVNFPDNQVTKAMSGEAHAETTVQILMELLKDSAARSPMLIVVEDAHWLDSASWALLERVALEIDLLLVITVRPMKPVPERFRKVLQMPGATRVELAALAPRDAITLVCQRFGVRALPDSVAALIHKKAEGHPLFSEEIAYLLRDAGILQIQHGECRLSSEQILPEDALERILSDQGLPATVQGVIMSRLDRLPQALLLTTKVASVIGRSFGLPALRDVYPVAVGEEELAEHLRELARLHIAEPERTGGSDSYRFRHAVTQEAAYGAMLFAQRRSLHRAVAEWHERTYAAEIHRFYPVIAHHWRRAEDLPKAVGFLAKAGEQALGRYANQEAVRFLSDALELASRLDEESSRRFSAFERATWELRLGKAYTNWSKYREGREHIEKGLAVYDRAVPGGTAAIFRLAGQIARQLVHRMIPRYTLGRRRAERDVLLETARAYEGLAEICLLQNEFGKCGYSVLRSLNLAELAGLSAELARNYATVGVILGCTGVRRLAEKYCERAERTAREHGDPAAEAWVALFKGIYKSGLGAWEDTERLFEKTASISRRLNDRRRVEDSMHQLAFVRYLRGDFSGSLRLLDEMYDSTRRGADERGRAAALRLRSLSLIRRNMLDEIPGCAEEIRSLRWGTDEVLSETVVHSMLAEFHFRKGEREAARREVDSTLDHLSRCTTILFEMFPDYSTAAELSLRLLETEEGEPAPARERWKRALKACRMQRKFSRLFPVGRPVTDLCRGMRLWLENRQAGAFSAWRQSLENARQLGMPYHEGLAQFEIGRHLAPGSPGREPSLKEARETFKTLGADYNRVCAERELARS
jgi:predicted ATPase/class 3 adenylate cyclase